MVYARQSSDPYGLLKPVAAYEYRIKTHVVNCLN